MVDITVGSVLIANRGSKRVRQIAFLTFVAYISFLIYSMMNGNWTCNCFGGNKNLLFPLAIDIGAAAYFGAQLRNSDAGSLDYQLLAMLCCILGAAFIWFQFSKAPIEFVRSKMVDSSPEWKKSEFLIKNNTQFGINLTGIAQSCSFVPLSALPLMIEPSEAATVEVMIRDPGGRVLNYIDGRIELFYESSNATHSHELHWGLEL